MDLAVLQRNENWKHKVTNEEVFHSANVNRNYWMILSAGKWGSSGILSGKKSWSTWLWRVSKERECKGGRSKPIYVLAKEEISDTDTTHPLCIWERCLVWVVKIAAAVRMIEHMMLMMMCGDHTHTLFGLQISIPTTPPLRYIRTLDGHLSLPSGSTIVPPR